MWPELGLGYSTCLAQTSEGRDGVLWGQGQGPGQLSRAAAPLLTLPFKEWRILNLNLAFWGIGKSVYQAGGPEHVSSKLADLTPWGALFVLLPSACASLGALRLPSKRGNVCPSITANRRLSPGSEALAGGCSSVRLCIRQVEAHPQECSRSESRPPCPLWTAHQGPVLAGICSPVTLSRTVSSLPGGTLGKVR